MTNLYGILLFTCTTFLLFPAKAKWVKLDAGTSTDMTEVFFTSESKGYMIQGDSLILRTLNGGNDWDVITSKTIKPNVYWWRNQLLFINDSTGFVTDDRKKIYKTMDSGDSWIEVTPAGLNVIYKMQFLNEQKGFVYGSYGTIYITDDSGASWDEITLPFGLHSLTTNLPDMVFLDDSTGFLAGADGSFLYKGIIAKTTDGGNTWAQSFLPSINSLVISLHFPSRDTGYAVTLEGLFRTINEGMSWDSVGWDVTSKLNPASVSEITFTDNETAYMATGSKIYKTINGGTNWTVDFSDTMLYNLNSLSFINGETGFAAGNNGALLKKSTSSGTMEVNSKKLNLYPNPTSGKLTLTTNLGTIGNVLIYNSSGQVTSSMDFAQHTIVEFDISSYPAGLYLIKVENGDNFSFSKVMKY